MNTVETTNTVDKCCTSGKHITCELILGLLFVTPFRGISHFCLSLYISVDVRRTASTFVVFSLALSGCLSFLFNRLLSLAPRCLRLYAVRCSRNQRRFILRQINEVTRPNVPHTRSSNLLLLWPSDLGGQSSSTSPLILSNEIRLSHILKGSLGVSRSAWTNGFASCIIT